MTNRRPRGGWKMTKDDLIREYNDRASSWQVLVGIYATLVGLMVATACAII